MPPQIKESGCVGCGTCVNTCPPAALKLVGGVSKVAEPSKCIGCWACVTACPLKLIGALRNNFP